MSYRVNRFVLAVVLSSFDFLESSGFFAVSLGDVSPRDKYTHNAVFFLGSALLGAWALSRNRASQDAPR